MRKLFKPWMLVTIGILFNIASAIITHYFIGLNNQKLNEIDTKATQFDTFIDGQWRSKTEIQQRQEFQLLLLTQAHGEHAEDIQQIITRQLNQTLQQQNLDLADLRAGSAANFDTIQQISDAASQKIIMSINDTYLDKLDLQQQVHPLQEKNSLLFTVSIFLQLTGLILVLSRDILGE